MSRVVVVERLNEEQYVKFILYTNELYSKSESQNRLNSITSWKITEYYDLTCFISIKPIFCRCCHTYCTHFNAYQYELGLDVSKLFTSLYKGHLPIVTSVFISLCFFNDHFLKMSSHHLHICREDYMYLMHFQVATSCNSFVTIIKIV